MDFIRVNVLPIGVVLVGLFSGTVAQLLPRPQHPRFRWWLCYGIPSVFTIIVLFSPIRGMSKDSPSEPTCGWDAILLAMCATSGSVVSTLVVERKDRIFKRKSEPTPNP